MNQILFITISVLLISCSDPGHQKTPENKMPKTDLDTSGKSVVNPKTFSEARFEICVNQSINPDLVSEFTYHLIDLSKNDSTHLLTTNRHDLPPPNHFWTPNQEMLIYEKDDGYGSKSEIIFLNPKNKKIRHRTDGFFQYHQNNEFLDRGNGILFFFTSLDFKKISIMQIDLSNFKDSLLYEFSCSDMFERPSIKTNSTERTLTYEYSCQESSKRDMTNEKGEIKY